MRSAFLAMICAIVFLLVTILGCNGIVAKGPTSAAIDADVVVMQQRIAATQPAEALASNAERFKVYYDTATVNFFAYLLGGKTIYCTPVIYSDLQGKAVRSAIYVERIRTSTQPVNSKLWLECESTWMLNIFREKAGK